MGQQEQKKMHNAIARPQAHDHRHSIALYSNLTGTGYEYNQHTKTQKENHKYTQTVHGKLTNELLFWLSLDCYTDLLHSKCHLAKTTTVTYGHFLP